MPDSERVRLAAGAVVAGRFRIRSILLQERFGVVYLAEMLANGAAVALKLIDAPQPMGGEQLARFKREAEIVASLGSPHIMQVVDYGAGDDGRCYIAFEYLNGYTLEQALTAGPQSGSFVGPVALQVLDALDLMHARGIVHREIKPSNIFLCGDRLGDAGTPFVKLIGFELARPVDGASGDHQPELTALGQIVGTPDYMAPEQAQGRAVTAAADLYALGMVMAESLIGRKIIAASSDVAALMAQGSEASIELPPAVLSSPLARIIERALRKAPGDRWPNARAMREALDELMGRSRQFGTDWTTAETVERESAHPPPPAPPTAGQSPAISDGFEPSATSSGEFDPRALEAGMMFHGSYQIVRRIGAGGMGAVYEVLHTTTKRRRALKVMLPDVVSDDDMRERFKLEATVCAQVTSDHIAEILDAGVDEATGIPFIVMELLTGHELGDLVEGGAPLSYQDVVELLSQAALGLDRTHAQRIVHRDLKPANLFVTRRDDGTVCVKILDFGVAKIVSATMSEAQRTRTLGSPLYMAPEQIAGEGVDRPSDLYALAHIAFTLLAGDAYWSHTFREVGSVYPVLVQIMKGLPETASARSQRLGGSTLPPSFDAWFARAAALDPVHRFNSASEQIVALADALGVARPSPSVSGPYVPVVGASAAVVGPATVGLPAGASTTSAIVAEGTKAPQKRGGWRVAGAVILGAAATAALAFGWYQHQGSTSSPAATDTGTPSPSLSSKEGPGAVEDAPSPRPTTSSPALLASAAASAREIAVSAAATASAAVPPAPSSSPVLQPRRPARPSRGSPTSPESDPLDTF